jgi:hypothetical protein
MASAWPIRRFIDPKARFKFVPAKDYRPRPRELRFDMFDAEYTHEGDRCTFEVLIQRFGFDDPGLRHLAEIVHDIDLKDAKFGREEPRVSASSSPASPLPTRTTRSASPVGPRSSRTCTRPTAAGPAAEGSPSPWPPPIRLPRPQPGPATLSRRKGLWCRARFGSSSPTSCASGPSAMTAPSLSPATCRRTWSRHAAAMLVLVKVKRVPEPLVSLAAGVVGVVLRRGGAA